MNGDDLKSATAFADRNRWVGDIPGVPVAQLTAKAFAAERACGFDPAKAQARPIACRAISRFGQRRGRQFESKAKRILPVFLNTMI